MYRLRNSINAVCFFITLTTSLWAQHHVNFTHLSPSLNNKAINVGKTIQDASGNIWMVQGGDVYMYDGYSYKMIDNPVIFPKSEQHESIKQILIDDFKNIWLLSDEIGRASCRERV